MRRPVPALPRRLKSERGFTILELLVAAVIMLVVTGAIFALVDPSRGTFRAQPEVSDIQQRMRVGVDMLSKDLVMAGAGVYMGTGSGALIKFFAPVLPFGRGERIPAELRDRYSPDIITIAYVPNTPAQAAVRDAMPDQARVIKAFPQPSCGDEDVSLQCPDGTFTDGSLCGFCPNDRVVIFDDTGSFDFLTVTRVNAGEAVPGPLLQHDGQTLSKHYCPEDDPPMQLCDDPNHNPQLAKVETHTYFLWDNQLFHHAGGDDVPVPIVDNVVDLRFEYFGDPIPPVNVGCDAARALPVIDAGGSSLVEITEAMLTQGDMCPYNGHPNAFDADLYRVRKVRVRLRIQTPLDDLRGPEGFLFRNAGNSSSGTRFVPDYELSFEISPRNMTLAR